MCFPSDRVRSVGTLPVLADYPLDTPLGFADSYAVPGDPLGDLALQGGVRQGQEEPGVALTNLLFFQKGQHGFRQLEKTQGIRDGWPALAGAEGNLSLGVMELFCEPLVRPGGLYHRDRSEERRVGREWRSRGSRAEEKEKN